MQQYASPAVSAPEPTAAPTQGVTEFGSNMDASAAATADPISALLAAATSGDSSSVLDILYDLGAGDLQRLRSDAGLSEKIRGALSSFAQAVYDCVVGSEEAVPTEDGGASPAEIEQGTDVIEAQSVPALGALPVPTEATPAAPEAAPEAAEEAPVQTAFDQLKAEIDAGVPDPEKASDLLMYLDEAQLRQLARGPRYAPLANRLGPDALRALENEVAAAFPSPADATAALRADPAVAAEIEAYALSLAEQAKNLDADALAAAMFTTQKPGEFGQQLRRAISLHPGADTIKTLGLGQGTISGQALVDSHMSPDGPPDEGFTYSSMGAKYDLYVRFQPRSSVPGLSFEIFVLDFKTSELTLRQIGGTVTGTNGIDLALR